MPHGRHLFVSDLHLDASAAEAVAQFRLFLQTEARSCDGLYILGDLFETWIGDDDDDPVRLAVAADLHALTAGGTPCFIQRGNRDFLLGDGFMQRSGCTLLPDPAVMQQGTRRIVLMHGDLLCTADHRYQQFRTQSRDWHFQSAYLHLPLATRRALAEMARASSREHTRRMRMTIMDVEPHTVQTVLRCAGSDLLIHGHTHRPGVHKLQVDGREAHRIVLGDWYDQGSCLALNADGSYDLGTIEREAPRSTVNIASSRPRV